MRGDLGENSILGFLFQFLEKLVVRVLVVLIKKPSAYCLIIKNSENGYWNFGKWLHEQRLFVKRKNQEKHSFQSRG